MLKYSLLHNSDENMFIFQYFTAIFTHTSNLTNFLIIYFTVLCYTEKKNELGEYFYLISIVPFFLK